MDLRLSWDLFIIVFFALILAFSFIIGRKQTIKIVIATYVAFLSADAFGFFIKETIGFGIPAKLFSFEPAMAVVVTKILIFVLLIVILARHHAFEVGIEDESSTLSYMLSTLFVGFLSATLMMVAVLYYVSGSQFSTLEGSITSSSLLFLKSQSDLVRKLIDYAYIWFFMPAASLLALTFLQRK